jgi:hypothetical protein
MRWIWMDGWIDGWMDFVFLAGDDLGCVFGVSREGVSCCLHGRVREGKGFTIMKGMERRWVSYHAWLLDG